MISERDMMHGRPWRGEEIAGWVVSEKLDGCRGYWDGGRMWSRSGRAFSVPPEWVAELPRMHLEGEVWAGRGAFANSVRAVVNNVWSDGVCFVIFDAPEVSGTWPERMAEVAKMVRGSRAAAPIPWTVTRTLAGLARVFRRVGKGGGEGLILRCPELVGYRRGRSDRVLKLTRDPVTGWTPPGRLVVEKRMRMEHADA